MKEKKVSIPAAPFSLCIALAALSFAGCASVPPDGMDPVKTVDHVDVERYAGRWYEIARYQSGFEKNVYGATAEYTLREDGKIGVVNSGFKNGLDGKYTRVKATAWVPDRAAPASLKVKFFGLIVSDYMIIGLDEKNYEWAVVGNDSRKYLWFLARGHEIDDALYEKMENIAESQGFDTEKLFRVPQKPR